MAGRVNITAEQFVARLPARAELYTDVLERLEGMDNAYVQEVLERARARPVTWLQPCLYWEEELETFLSGKRGAGVFREWLKIPYVRDTAKQLCDTSSDDGFSFDEPSQRTIKLCHPARAWVSLGHALADLALTDQLQILLEEVPESGELKVRECYECQLMFGPCIWRW
jgi:hypothetical protein